MARERHFLHIKRHTKGTSNELSLDVLDAARDQLDSQKKRKETKNFLLDFRRNVGDGHAADGASKASAVSVSGGGVHRRNVTEAVDTAASSRFKWPFSKAKTSIPAGNPLIPVDEVLRRKRARRRNMIRLRALIAVVVIVAIGILGWMGYRGYQAKEAFEDQYRALVSDVSAADPVLVELDGMMDEPLEGTTDEQRILARKKAVAVTSAADKAVEGAEALYGKAPGDPDKVALDQLIEGAKGRVSMVGLIMEVFGIVDRASEARQAANTTWDWIVNTDIAARDAISKSNEATTAGALDEATSAIRVARDEFGAALQQLTGLENTAESLDLSDQKAFVEKRIEALDCALATNEALSAGDRQAAAEHNAEYDAADKESAELAEKLPQSIDDLIVNVFTDDVLKAQARYDTQREQVAKADSLVRKYLRG